MADEYGITAKGPNIKRLDTIIEEIHKDLSDKWGVNTRQNPYTLLNNLITNFADKIAELWEFGEEIYNSQYISSAEGQNLDNAAQYGGVLRATARRSYYPIHCTGKDGTELAVGTRIVSNTNPSVYLVLTEKSKITRTAFNAIQIKVSPESGHRENQTYSITLNNTTYSYTDESTVVVESAIITGLYNQINGHLDGYTVTKISIGEGEENTILQLEALSKTSIASIALSENLTTETVTSIITFGTEETGDVFLPDGTITVIEQADPGLQSIINKCGYIRGRDDETDVEFRQSYIAKIFNRSTSMLESIRAEILTNVQGVTSVAVYENPSNITSEGRPPHSIEIVVDGGNESEIAECILAKKAGGIDTVGEKEIGIVGDYGETIPIRFNRPETMYVWFDLTVTVASGDTINSDSLKNAIVRNINALSVGESVIPQHYLSDMYKACPNMRNVSIDLYSSTDNIKPAESVSYVTLAAKQRAYTTENMIEIEVT